MLPYALTQTQRGVEFCEVFWSISGLVVVFGAAVVRGDHLAYGGLWGPFEGVARGLFEGVKIAIDEIAAVLRGGGGGRREGRRRRRSGLALEAAVSSATTTAAATDEVGRAGC